MTVKFIKSPSGAPYFLGYFIGDVTDLEGPLAKDLIDQKIAEPIDQKTTPAANAEKAISKQAQTAEKR